MSLPREEGGMPGLSRELRAIEDRALALSVYDHPEHMSLSDIIIFALTVYDTPEREVNPEQLKEVLTKCGQFGVVAIDGVTADYPYLHLGRFNDSLESLMGRGIVGIVEGDGVLGLTPTGREIGAAMLAGVGVQSHSASRT